MTGKRYYVNCAGYLCDKELSNTLSIFECADLLNEQEERIKHLERKLERERRATQKQHQKWSDEAEKRIKELEETIGTIAKDYEESHGMDIRNAEWFTAW